MWFVDCRVLFVDLVSAVYCLMRVGCAVFWLLIVVCCLALVVNAVVCAV